MHMQGNYSSAEHYYLRALEIDPSNVILKENLQKLSRIQSRAQTHENWLYILHNVKQLLWISANLLSVGLMNHTNGVKYEQIVSGVV